MTDRVYPSKPPTNGTATTTATANPSFPATKGQLYGANRPAYRPQPQRKHRSRRGCCCKCCLWTTILLLVLILLVGIAGTVVYVLYRPHRPTFTVTGFKISSLNVTKSSTLTTNININITARNPNKRIIFTYNPTSIVVSTASDGVIVGNGNIPSFVHGKKNTTVLKPGIDGGGIQLDDLTAEKLRKELKSKNGVGLKLVLNTKVKVKMGVIKSPKVGIRVTCEGIKGTVPTGKTATTASVGNAKCKVDVRFKIWKWTV